MYKDGLAGVILENTFSSIGDMVNVMFPKLRAFKWLVLRNYWPSVDRIGTITLPLLFIFSMRDELVPPEQMSHLFVKATQSRFKMKVSHF